jgi:hypothetical protein
MSLSFVDQLKEQKVPKQKGAQRDPQGKPRSKGLPSATLLYTFASEHYKLSDAFRVITMLDKLEITIKEASQLAKAIMNTAVWI